MNGLQAGIRIANGRTAFAPGEGIWQETYLRNRSRETVYISLIGGCEEQGDPILTDAKGGLVKVVRYFGMGFFVPKQIAVPSGEIKQVGLVGLALHPPTREESQPHEVAPGISSVAEGLPYAIAGPGTYALKQVVSPTDADRKPLTFQLHTPSLPIQIKNVPPVPTIRVDPNAIADLATAPIAWGAVHAGLQVGLFCLGSKEEFFVGERVEVAVILRNVSQAPIRFHHQASFGFLEAPHLTGADGNPKRVLLAPATEWRGIGAIRMTGVTFDLSYAPSAGGPSSIRETEIAPGQSVLGYSLTGFVVPARWQDGKAVPGRYLLKQSLRVGLGKGEDLETILETGDKPILLSDPDVKPNRSNRL